MPLKLGEYCVALATGEIHAVDNKPKVRIAEKADTLAERVTFACMFLDLLKNPI